jgi:hypothetical protein
LVVLEFQSLAAISSHLLEVVQEVLVEVLQVQSFLESQKDFGWPTLPVEKMPLVAAPLLFLPALLVQAPTRFHFQPALLLPAPAP